MQDVPRSRRAILERFHSAAASLDDALGRLTDEQMLASPAGGWSSRDVIAHIAADHRWFAGQLLANAEGRMPTALECYGTDEPPDPRHDLATQDGRNAAQYERNRAKGLQDVRDDLVRYRSALLDLIEALPESEFELPYALEPRGHVGWVHPARSGEEGFPLWRWMQGNTWHHYEEHLRDLQGR